MCETAARGKMPNHCAWPPCPEPVLCTMLHKSMCSRRKAPATPAHLGEVARACKISQPEHTLEGPTFYSRGLVAPQLLDVRDVIPRVAVERLLQPQLVEVVANETNGAAQHEQAVEAPKGHQVPM